MYSSVLYTVVHYGLLYSIKIIYYIYVKYWKFYVNNMELSNYYNFDLLVYKILIFDIIKIIY